MIFITHTPRLSVSVATSAFFFKAGWGAGGEDWRKGDLRMSLHCNLNRLFYRYGGHIELIRFKKYYRMPRGREHISFVFSSAFRDIFS